MHRLADKVVVVSSTSTGLGRHFMRALLMLSRNVRADLIEVHAARTRMSKGVKAAAS